MILDIETLNKYVSFQMSVRTNENGNDWYYKFGMRMCREKDYADRGFKMTPKLIKKIERRICPDLPTNLEVVGVQNEDSDEDFRKSFSIEITKCLGNECMEKTKIDKLLSKIYFTLFAVQESI